MLTHYEPVVIHCLAASVCPAEKCLISADTKCDVKCSATSPRWESVTTAIFFTLVMISNETEVVDHCPKVLPSGEWLHVQDGMLAIEVVFKHVTLLYERRSPRVELAEGIGARGDGYATECPGCLSRPTLSSETREDPGISDLPLSIGKVFEGIGAFQASHVIGARAVALESKDLNPGDHCRHITTRPKAAACPGSVREEAPEYWSQNAPTAATVGALD